ncbi:MAG: N-6 DNA methylase [Desulfobacterales bacterium]
MFESRYISETSLSHRKAYGQFFTPSPIARLMVQWILKGNPKTVLDPAFGLGIFYDEISKSAPIPKPQVAGYEIDENILSYLRDTDNSTNLTLVRGDYLESDTGPFDGIVCNPPYMRFQKFLNRHSILPKIEKQTGRKLAGYSNISSVFLLKAISELNPDGNLAFIMPFEFFNAGYGTETKKSLLEKNLLKQIIIFENEKEIFPDATTTVCVLLCRKDGKKEPVKITKIKANEDILQLADITDFYQRTINASELGFSRKWSPVLLSLFSEQAVAHDFVTLSCYGSVTRGIATGANAFFALTKTEIKKWNLDNGSICRCITKSSQIRRPVFTEHEFEKLYDSDKAVHCLRVSGHESKEVQTYIKEGEKLGCHQRYLTRMRTPWYKTEYRKPAPLLFGVFNRGRCKVIRNFTTAVTFTCFHAFYPSKCGERLINKLFLYLLSDIGQEIIKNNKRSYGNGLDKFEPGDLNACICPNQNQFEMIDDSHAERITEIARFDEEGAIQMSNEFIRRIIPIRH